MWDSFSSRTGCIWRFLALFLLIASGFVHAQSEREDELIARLATTTDRAELRSTLASIREFYAEESVSPEFRDSLVQVATTSENVRRTAYVDPLINLAGQDRAHSERSLILIAQALSREPPFSSYKAKTAALQARADDLPDSVFEILLDGFGGPHPILPLRVLSAMPADNARYERVVGEISGFLRLENGNRAARAFISELGRMYESRAMPASLIDALNDKALSDPRLDVRVEAFDALAPHPLGAERAKVLAQTLYENVTQPDTSTNDGLEYSQFSLPKFRERVAIALLDVLEPPYPQYVVDQWLSMLLSMQHARAMEVVQGAIDRPGLTDEQFGQLVRKLDAGGGNTHYPTDPLALEFPPMSPEDRDDAVRTFSANGDELERVAAGYRLHFHYKDDGVPVEIADTALASLSDRRQHALLPVSLVLVSRAAADTDRYTSKLIRLAGRRADNHQFYRQFLRTLGADNAAALVFEHAGNSKLASRFRAQIMDMIDAERVDDRVRIELIDRLNEIAQDENDNAVLQAAGRALDELGERAPVRVALRNTENIRTAMFIGFATMLLGNVLLFFVGLAAIAWPIPANAEGKLPSAGGRLVGWLFLSAVVAVALIIGLAGFIGHNSAPPIGWTMTALLPAMLFTVIYLVVAVIAVRRTRRLLRTNAATD